MNSKIERSLLLHIRVILKDKEQEKLDEIKEMITVAKLEKMTILEQQVRSFYYDEFSNDKIVIICKEHLHGQIFWTRDLQLSTLCRSISYLTFSIIRRREKFLI